MSEYATVRYERDGPVAVVTLYRPDAMNAFDETMRRELLLALRQAAGDGDARVVVLTGEGRSFCAGADLREARDASVRISEVLQKEYRPALECIWSMDKPVIAAIGGSVAGIGTSFALACDLLVMSEEAFMLSPFTTISLVPDGGLNWLLVHQLGYRRAFQLSIESERIGADRCLELGLANKVVAAGRLMEETLSWARRIAERAPLSVAATKAAMRHATSGSWASTFDIEAPTQQNLRASDDCAEGIAAFLEKRKPDFRGH